MKNRILADRYSNFEKMNRKKSEQDIEKNFDKYMKLLAEDGIPTEMLRHRNRRCTGGYVFS